MKKEIVCKTCDDGTMRRVRVYRMSGPVVFIGYLLLVPSLLGIAFGGLVLVAFGSAASEELRAPEAARKVLQEKGLPAASVERVVSGGSLTPAMREQLTREQLAAVTSVQTSMSAERAGRAVGAGIGGIFAVIIMIASFIGGLLGWLLVMKKRVLQCDTCGAVVAAG